MRELLVWGWLRILGWLELEMEPTEDELWSVATKKRKLGAGQEDLEDVISVGKFLVITVL